MKTRKILYGCLIIFVNAFVLYGLLQTTITKMQDEARTLEAKKFIEETNTYRISDLYGLPSCTRLQTFLEKKDSYESVNSLYQNLINEKEFRFLEFSDVLLQWQGYYEDERQFVDGYEDYSAEELDEFINQKISYDGTEILVTNIKGSIIGKETCSYLKIQDKITQGESLSEEDFCLKGDKIPVLLGYNYTENHSVGETISIFYLGEPLVFEVKGILEKGTVITIGKNIQSLDNRIVVPSFEITEDQFQSLEENEKSTFLLHYLYKVEGYVLVESEESILRLNQIIDNGNKEKKLEFSCEPVGIESGIEKSLQQAVKSYKVINLFTIFEMIILGAILLCIFIIHFQKKQKDYAIHLICGATLQDIKKKSFLEFGSFMFLGYIISIIVFEWTEYKMYASTLIQQSTGIILLLNCIVFGCVMVLANWYINHTSIYLQLRRK